MLGSSFLALAGAPETFPRHSAGLELLLSAWILSPFPPGNGVYLPVGTFQMSWFVFFGPSSVFLPLNLAVIFFFSPSFCTLIGSLGQGRVERKMSPGFGWLTALVQTCTPLAWASWWVSCNSSEDVLLKDNFFLMFFILWGFYCNKIGIEIYMFQVYSIMIWQLYSL